MTNKMCDCNQGRLPCTCKEQAVTDVIAEDVAKRKRVAVGGNYPIRRPVVHESVLSELRQQLADVSAERDHGFRSALELAKAMSRDVKDLSPKFGFFENTWGVIGQIDNMYVGMRAERDALKLSLNASEKRNAELCRLLVKGGSVIDQMGLAIGAADEYGDFEHEIKDAQELAAKMIATASQSAPATDEQVKP